MKWFIGGAFLGIFGTMVADLWWFSEADIKTAANLSLVYLAVLTAIFAVRYGLWSQWYASRIGRNYLIFKVVMSLVLIQIVLATWWDTDFPGRQHIRFLIYSLGAVAAVPMLVSLVREQRADEKLRQTMKPRQRSSHQSRSSSSGSDSSQRDLDGGSG